MRLVPTSRNVLLVAGGLAAVATAALAQQQQAPAAAQPPGEFTVCSACHETKAGAAPSLGPNLFGVGGRKAGSVADYDYSPAMKAATIVWNADTLAAFVADPNKAVAGNKMDYSGTDAATAKAIADYLMTLK
jgi:cytochrome c